MGPLNPLGTLDSQGMLEAEAQRSIQPGPAGGVARLLKSEEKPVPAYWVSSFLKERHHDFCRPQGNVRAMD